MKVVINYQEYADVEIEKKIIGALPGVEIVESRTREGKEFLPLLADADAALIQYVKMDEKAIHAMKQGKVKVLSRPAVEFFKKQARQQHTQYQKMIRRVLDLYASRYQR